jgi:hypothetical protein
MNDTSHIYARHVILFQVLNSANTVSMHPLSLSVRSLPARLLLLLLATILEFLCLLVCLLDRLADLPLLLACLDGNSQIFDATFLGSFANCALGLLPLCSARADLVSNFPC